MSLCVHAGPLAVPEPDDSDSDAEGLGFKPIIPTPDMARTLFDQDEPNADKQETKRAASPSRGAAAAKVR